MEKLRTQRINLHSDHCDLWQKGINKARAVTVVPFYLVHLLKNARKGGCSRLRLFSCEEEATLTRLCCRTTLTQLLYQSIITMILFSQTAVLISFRWNFI